MNLSFYGRNHWHEVLDRLCRISDHESAGWVGNIRGELREYMLQAGFVHTDGEYLRLTDAGVWIVAAAEHLKSA